MLDKKIQKTAEIIKDEILGKRYELSFAFISEGEIKNLNKQYRKKNEPTDILSFPLEKNFGEILICKDVAKIKSKKFGLTFQEYLIFLVIHGLLHLKGLHHGDKMKKYELVYNSRYRCRHFGSARCCR